MPPEVSFWLLGERLGVYRTTMMDVMVVEVEVVEDMMEEVDVVQEAVEEDIVVEDGNVGDLRCSSTLLSALTRKEIVCERSRSRIVHLQRPQLHLSLRTRSYSLVTIVLHCIQHYSPFLSPVNRNQSEAPHPFYRRRLPGMIILSPLAKLRRMAIGVRVWMRWYGRMVCGARRPCSM